jgi:hypothetical protein
VGVGNLQTVSDELNLIASDRLLPAHVSRERDPFTVLECALLTVDVDGHRCVAGGSNTLHSHRLKIGTVFACGLDAPLRQVLRDVAGRQSQPFGVDLAPLEFIGGDVAQPLFEL